MNLEGGFEALGRKKSGSGGANESPEDLLFAAGADASGEDSLPNPYGDDDGFDDASEQGLGPCATFGVAAHSAAVPPTLRGAGQPADLDVDDELDALLGDGVGGIGQAVVGEIPPVEEEAVSGLQIGPPQVPPPMPVEARPKAAAPGLARAEAPAGAPVGGGDEPRAASRSPQPRIPGRDRVSYSTTPKRVAAVVRPPQPAREPLPVVPARGSSALAWCSALVLLCAGGAAGAYFGMIVGSAVLGGVSFTLGLIGAMFMFVLFRR